MFISDVDCEACQWKPVPDVVGGILIISLSKSRVHQRQRQVAPSQINNKVPNGAEAVYSTEIQDVSENVVERTSYFDSCRIVIHRPLQCRDRHLGQDTRQRHR